ncbi:MAG: RNA pseudouridine synthase [Lachnospiraceae bacterium]
MEIEVLFEDTVILVCRKQAGIPTQTPKQGQPDMVSLLRNYRAGKGEDTYIGLIHRLDQPVEGIMVFAKTKDAAANLSRQMREFGLEKQYLAVIEGKMEKEKATLIHYLLRDGRNNTTTCVSERVPGAKRGELEYTVMEEIEGESLLRIRLKTGRHHQIRVQMAEVGHPIIGDKKYNKNADQKRYLPLLLCSEHLEFHHPQTGKVMQFFIKPTGEGFRKFQTLE